MASGERKVLLAITDISGYTQFMLSNKTSLTHSQDIITELIRAIVDEVEIPLEISKLQGDSVFLYAIKDSGDTLWENSGKKSMGRKLLSFFHVFSNKIAELSESHTCKCGACENIDNLKLKIVVHSGDALFYSIGKFEELSGIDVIIAYRLLKNSVESAQYILMTQTAYEDLELPEEIEIVEGAESYAEIGALKTYTCFPP